MMLTISSGQQSVFLFHLVIILPGVCFVSGYVESDRCDPDKCQLPNCFCPGTEIPGNLKRDQTPQMVLFTFDDAVNEQMWSQIRNLFTKERKNPNGCRIIGTFFVSHNWTDYCMVNKLWAWGHEIASHSITHRIPTDWWQKASLRQWTEEMQGQKKIIHKKGKVFFDEILGTRSPFLASGGDTMFTMIQSQKFEYDSSMVVQELDPDRSKPWPFTLDYPKSVQCILPPCPEKSFPGIWEVPIIPLLDMAGQACSFLDKCLNPPNSASNMTQMLWKNFWQSYKTNRAPVIINVHPSWLKNYTLKGVDNFIKKLLKTEDVWLISVYQAVAWMRNPATVDQLKYFKPWKCIHKSARKCSVRNIRSVKDGGSHSSTDVGSELIIPFIVVLACSFIIYLGCIRPMEEYENELV